ncbi:MAG: hypothetical protein LRZ85_03940 [Alphaproteobacteria bacterium]|nr:hypothetical protein [Alphaproteobacteria bacterium]
MTAALLVAANAAFAMQMGSFSPPPQGASNPLLTPVFDGGGAPQGPGLTKTHHRLVTAVRRTPKVSTRLVHAGRRLISSFS